LIGFQTEPSICAFLRGYAGFGGSQGEGQGGISRACGVLKNCTPIDVVLEKGGLYDH
jgi:hypothetical protein